MLEVERLEVSYGKLVAVSSISLKVEAGEVVGLIGPNGAGKTTTLSAIAGVRSSVRGSIALEGESLVGLAPETIVRKGIALVPEGRHVFASLTVDQNLRLGATIRKDGEVDSDIEELKERFPALRRYEDVTAGSLSGGEQQQIAIGRALMSRPRLLLLDEPSLGLAPLVVEQVFQMIERFREEGMTVLLVEQNGLRTLELADRTYVLQSGSIVMTATGPEDFPAVEKAYFGTSPEGGENG